jgi:hypothetical protein
LEIYNLKTLMPIEQDTRNATNPLPLLVLTGAVACIALILGALALWLHVNNRKLTLNQRTQVVEAEDGLSQAIRQRDLARQQAQQLFNIANDKQRFIDESFWHFARFLTNAHVREIELATGRA